MNGGSSLVTRIPRVPYPNVVMRLDELYARDGNQSTDAFRFPARRCLYDACGGRRKVLLHVICHEDFLLQKRIRTLAEDDQQLARRCRHKCLGFTHFKNLQPILYTTERCGRIDPWHIGFSWSVAVRAGMYTRLLQLQKHCRHSQRKKDKK